MPDRARWQQLFDKEITDYRTHYARTGDLFGWFSVPQFDVATKIGLLIKDMCPQAKCLDIGCGALRRPVYMAEGMNFTGVDPDPGFQKRDFPFIQMMGEDLLFSDASFDCVTLMSTLDHVLDPEKVLSEAYRVLRRGGYVFVWYRDEAVVDGHHLHHFTNAMMQDLLTRHGFINTNLHFYPHNPAKGYPDTTLAIARKA